MDHKKKDGWYLGWCREIQGVNTQARNMKELKENFDEALELILKVRSDLNPCPYSSKDRA